MEFHVSRYARDRYQFDLALFSYSGNAILANFNAAHHFALQINTLRATEGKNDPIIHAGQINALGLLDEILHHMVALYRTQANPRAIEYAYQYLKDQLGKEILDHTLSEFAHQFPPLQVYTGAISLQEYLVETTDGVPNHEILLEEMILLWITNQNPAAVQMKELFSDNLLDRNTEYTRLISLLQAFFSTQPPFGPERLSLLEFLQAPAKRHPDSLAAQLDFVRQRWGEALGSFTRRLLIGLDFIKEEEKPVFFSPAPTLLPLGSDLIRRPGSDGDEVEPEAFSADRDWMPRLVLIAKNVYVWLHQLSKQYNRSITRLDQIPAEEIAQLAERGFTGLWLIGLWERSQASARIKQLCGNPEAIASAYSLDRYEIAVELGGEEAYDGLRDLSKQYGIRLASDMVPNHMGIDSSWVVHHPDWFIQLSTPPYPAYQYTGPDLSPVPEITLQVEDHYYNRQDAAVVFRHHDHRTGRVRYIYHGNDGTTMPWNDTAQLNYLLPDVRETVIQTILAVARRFPIIRFDAAMTLAKRHYQRLWYPEPGSGGAIPSRAEHAIYAEEFHAAFPVEFWREVVDRVALEVPDTLLLAEAFWLMEGYFVRSLGMHRVYNSAFMNMLRNEENMKYRTLIKTTLEYEPEILKRYVNFMNNPDERTAIDQFGNGEKYFGICTLMATLPGLPMFGHGQVEGYTEKYGMEYRRAYLDETPDQYLVERHQRQIAPLLHRRALFAEVDNFLLYDCHTHENRVDENVIAYTNRMGSECTLVIFNNANQNTQGWIRMSGAVVVRSHGQERYHSQRTLSEGLALHSQENLYIISRDWATGLEHIFPSREIAENGLNINLAPYEHHVFSEFREVQDDEHHSYQRLHAFLAGRGVPSILNALQELTLAPVLIPFRELVHPAFLSHLLLGYFPNFQAFSPASTIIHPSPRTNFLQEAENKYEQFLTGVDEMSGRSSENRLKLSNFTSALNWHISLGTLASSLPFPPSPQSMDFIEKWIQTHDKSKDRQRFFAIYGWVILREIRTDDHNPPQNDRTQAWDDWHLLPAFQNSLEGAGLSPREASETIDLIRLLLHLDDWDNRFGLDASQTQFDKLIVQKIITRFLRINRYDDILWFNQDAFTDFIWGLTTVSLFNALISPAGGACLFYERVILMSNWIAALRRAERESGYQVERLLAGLNGLRG